jgi:hypothetical protein
LVLIFPAGVWAQDPGSSDPAAGSPSGVIYELPVGRGRSDAAPKDGADGGASGSNYRSENGFGSSTEVPGAEGEDGEDSKGEDSEAAALGSGDPPDSGDTSVWRTLGLIALILVIGGGVALLAWQGRRRYSS